MVFLTSFFVFLNNLFPLLIKFWNLIQSEIEKEKKAELAQKVVNAIHTAAVTKDTSGIENILNPPPPPPTH